jgi:AraC family transcriptional regulator
VEKEKADEVRSEKELHYHLILAGVIEEVLRCQTGPIRVPDLANSAGFSRFHLARLFHETTEETLEDFLRRIRLERAAYMLMHSKESVLEISIDSGYRSPEAFSRAFRSAFGRLPSHFRKSASKWKLHATSDLHWNADWVLPDNLDAEYGVAVVSMPLRHACVWRAIGNYARLEQAWQRLGETYKGSIPSGATFISLYLDNMWTHPVCRTMRADIGWLCTPNYTPPPGMRRIILPGGCYASTRFVPRTERNDAWSYMSGRYTPMRGRRSNLSSYDEYGQWPLPFKTVQTKIYTGLAAGQNNLSH